MKKGILLLALLSITFIVFAKHKKKKRHKVISQTHTQLNTIINDSAGMKMLQGEYRLESLFDGKKMAKGNYRKTNIIIDKNRISCTVGCNGIGGDFKIEGNKIFPLKLTMTEMYCKDVDALERQFVDNLSNVNSYQFKNELLEFYNDNKLLMVLRRND